MRINKLQINLLSIAMFGIFLAGCASINHEAEACIAEKEILEANKKMVTEFYQALFGDKDISVVDEYIAKDYIQHNPLVADGRDALKETLEIWFTDAPKTVVDFQKVIADGDIVILHIRTKFGIKTFSLIDIFRIENGKIAEHWDVMQQVPSEAANEHPMF